MKTCIITRVYSSLLAALLTTGALAQDVKPLPAVVVTSASNVNDKVIQSFRGTFISRQDQEVRPVLPNTNNGVLRSNARLSVLPGKKKR